MTEDELRRIQDLTRRDSTPIPAGAVDVEGLKTIAVGDTVVRLLAGVVEMPLKVTALTPTMIVCGNWDFDRATGVEIDDVLGWGLATGITGSYITKVVKAEGR